MGENFSVLMETNSKEELIISMLNQGEPYNVIAGEAKTSPNYIKKVKEKYQEGKAFELFAKGYSPAKVKIELGIPNEDAAKHYLAYMKLVNLSIFFTFTM